MEKIWIKKELYTLTYDFLKFYDFSDFYLIFKVIFNLIKSQKGDLLTCRLTWRAAADVASGHADGSTWTPVWGTTWQAGRWRAH